MSDTEDGPSTSRSTRRSGVNSPRQSGKEGEPSTSAKKPASRDSQSSEPSRASSNHANFANREQQLLHTPDYGGNLFTGPTSRKREAKKNSRFSPPVEASAKKFQSASDKLSLAAAAFEFEDDPVVEPVIPKKRSGSSSAKTEITNIKHTVGVLQRFSKNLKPETFDLPSEIGGKGPDLYRVFKNKIWNQEGASTLAKPRRSNLMPSRALLSPSLPILSEPSSTVASSVARFDFDDGKPSTSAAAVVKPRRGRSIPDGEMKAVVKMEPEDEEVDHPPRGRKKRDEQPKEVKQETRGRPKVVKVKEEVMSEAEEAPPVLSPAVKPQPGRGRRSIVGASLPPPVPAAPKVDGRSKSARAARAVVKEEVQDDGYPDEQAARGGGGGVVAVAKRPEMGGHQIKRVIKTEPESDTETATVRPSRRSGKIDEQAAADKPSTSAATMAVAVAEPDGAASRKRGRGRPSFAFLAAAAAERAAAGIVEPPAKKPAKQDTPKATDGRLRANRAIAAAAAAEEESVKEESISPITPVLRRSTRVDSDDAGVELALALATLATPTIASTSKSPRGTISARGRGSGMRGRGGRGRPPGRPPGSLNKISPKALPSTPARPTSSMLAIEGAARESGGEEKEEEAQASTSASTSAGPPSGKKPRGRPRIYFDRPKQPYPYVSVAKRREQERKAAEALERQLAGLPPKEDEDEEEVEVQPKEEEEPQPSTSHSTRPSRRQTMPNQKFVNFMTEETTKIAKRQSAGAGTVPPTTPRSLAAAGVSIDLPPPRVRAPTPPPPEVVAKAGSALSIMRALNKNKKVLPSIRSPSPIPAGRRASLGRRPSTSGRPTSSLDTLAAAIPSLAIAPLIEPEEKEKEDEENKKEEECEDAPGPSRQRIASESAKEVEEAPADPVWITPEDIRGTSRRSSAKNTIQLSPLVQDPVTGSLARKEEKEEAKAPESTEAVENKEQEEKQNEPKEAEEGSPPESAAKKEETAQDLLDRWSEQRKAIDQERAEAGLPVVPPSAAADEEVAPAPLASRFTRRSINAPARYGDYDLNYGDARKRSATIGTPTVTPLSPVVPSSDAAKRRRKKKDETPSTPSTTRTVDEEDGQQQTPGSAEKNKKKDRPRLLLKLKLGGKKVAAAVGDGQEEEEEELEESEVGDADEPEEPMEDDAEGEADGDISVPVAGPSAATAVARRPAGTPAARKKDRKDRRSTRSKAKTYVKWKRTHVPHLGHIELDDKVVESVTLTCAETIDSMLLQICEDGIPKSTLSMKEQSSEHSRLAMARRRARGLMPVPQLAGAPRPKTVPIPIPPREERSKRIRHAPQSKEYDNLAASLTAPVESIEPFHVIAGMTDRRPSEGRRRESRQDAAAHRKESVVAERAERAERAAVKENEAPLPYVERPPKKEKKRDREREKEEVVNKNTISYAELTQQKAHVMERLPGRVISDPSDFFYREIFTDDVGDGIVEDKFALDVDVVGFTEACPDDLKDVNKNTIIGTVAEATATKLLAIFPRPQPYPDEDGDLDEDQEWMEVDMKRALAHHSSARLDLVERALDVINSQRMADLAVQGTKGAQDVLFNSHLAHAYRLKELLPVFSQFRLGESSWLHRTFIRLLPSYLLPVYLEILRFLKYSSDSKEITAALTKSLTERGVDVEWDAAFVQEQTDNDRTEPMLQGDGSSSSTTAAASSNSLLGAAPGGGGGDTVDTVASVDDVTATMEALLKTLEEAEKGEKEEAEAAATVPTVSTVPTAASPDSDQGGLMIDERTEEETAADEREGATVPTEATVVDGATVPTEATVVDGATVPTEATVVDEATVPTEATVVEGATVPAEATVVVQNGETSSTTTVEDVVEEKKEEVESKPELRSICAILAELDWNSKERKDNKVKDVNQETIMNSLDLTELSDVVPIMVAPSFEAKDPDFVVKNRPYEFFYRLIRYACSSNLKVIKPIIPPGECSVAEAMDAVVDQVIGEVKNAVRNNKRGRVILFGWGLSCYINHRVAQLVSHGISAIINFAFPLKTDDGWRGTPDDDICLTYCPTLFVMGSEAEDFDAYELLMMRQNMIQPPGALIVGSADSQLNISNHRLSRERITQKIAVRMIVEQVTKFINLPANQLEKAKLIPLQLNNVYFVEPSAVKSYNAQEAQQALVTGQPRRALPHTPVGDGGGALAHVNQAAEQRRRLQQIEDSKKRKRSRIEEQTTAAGRMASAIAASAAPITKRSRTDDLPSSSYGGRVAGDYRFSVPGPSPLASPLLNNSPTFRMMSRPAILSHSQHHHNYSRPLPSPIISGPSTSVPSSSGLLLQAASTRPANVADPSPRGPLDPASISLS